MKLIKDRAGGVTAKNNNTYYKDIIISSSFTGRAWSV